MEKAFFAFSAGMGPLIRCLPIANELSTREIQIGYYAIDKATKYMDQFNHQYLDIKTTFKPDKKLVVDKFSTYPNLSTYYSFLGYMDYSYVKRKIKIWVKKIKSFNPDIIISDCSLEAMITARILELPLIAISQSVFHPQNSMRWWENSKEQNELVINNINKIFRVFNKESVNIDEVEELFIGDKTIYPSIPEFDPAPGNSVIYSGPIIWNGLNTSFTNEEKFSTFESSDKELITVYTGRMKDLGGGRSGIIILKLLIEIFKGFDVNVLISTGGLDEIPKNENINIPENIKVVDWIPVNYLYDKSDLVIHHGGHGSCMSSIIYGTKTLCLPTHSEREYNARQLQSMGIGEFEDPRTVGLKQLKSTLFKLLKKGEYSKKATEKAIELKKEDYQKEKLVANVVEQLI